MGIDITLHARGLDRSGDGAVARFRAYLEATEGLPEECAERDAAAHALSLADAAEGYLRSSYEADGLFGTIDVVFGIGSMVFLFTFEEGKKTPLNGVELLSKVELLQRARARVTLGTALPAFDELMDVLLECPDAWAPVEARDLAMDRRRALDWKVRMDFELVRGQPTVALLEALDRRLAQLHAFASLAAGLSRRGIAVWLSVSM